MRNKNKCKKHLPPTPPFFPGLVSLLTSLPLPFKQHRGTGKGGCHQFITCCFCHSFLPSSLSSSHLSVESHSWETLLHKILHHGFFLQVMPPSGHVHLLGCRVLQSLQCRYLLHHGPPWMQRVSLPHHVLLYGLDWNVCPGAWLTSFPSFFTDLSIWRVVSLTQSHCSCCWWITVELFLHRRATTVADGLSFGHKQIHLAASWSWLCLIWWQLLASSHWSHPASKPCHRNKQTSRFPVLISTLRLREFWKVWWADIVLFHTTWSMSAKPYFF